LKKRAASLTVTVRPDGRDLRMWSFGALLGQTVLLRPYVFGFLLAFLVAAGRDFGPRRTLGFFAWGWAVAFAAEYSSTRIGIPFGLYHYTGATAGRELYLSNVPFFDSLSFVFLAYASLCLARWAAGHSGGAGIAVLAGILMMLLDVVVDPLAVRGGRWFLGDVFYYPAGGLYFGVPLSNFAGWMLVGWVTVGGYLGATRRGDVARRPPARWGPGVGLYYGVLLFSLAVTARIVEWGLLCAGILLHTATFLLLYGFSARGFGRLAAPLGQGRSAGRAG
jgi:uncharacterized membrane protein